LQELDGIEALISAEEYSSKKKLFLMESKVEMI